MQIRICFKLDPVVTRGDSEIAGDFFVTAFWYLFITLGCVLMTTCCILHLKLYKIALLKQVNMSEQIHSPSENSIANREKREVRNLFKQVKDYLQNWSNDNHLVSFCLCLILLFAIHQQSTTGQTEKHLSLRNVHACWLKSDLWS